MQPTKLLAQLLFPLLLILVKFSTAQNPVNNYSDRILRFHSDITVHPDGELRVKEHIRVYNGDGENTPGYNTLNSFYTNNDIQRGIVRDFPTRYADTSGYWVETGFDVKRVMKNDREEPFVKNNITNGKRLLIGSEDVILPAGVYDYIIEYETRRQLIFHNNKDELYWNVNGNGWVFTADTVSCTITFPEGASILEQACYTGVQGSTAHECNSKKPENNIITFTTTKKLESYEGLTVAAAIQKGIISPPSRTQEMLAFLSSNYIIPLLVLLFIFQLGYYLYVWYHKGRDPRKGIIYPQFSPPEGINPADAGFILQQKYNSNMFAAALIDCAVKKHLKIKVTREGMIFKSNVYHFQKPNDAIGQYDATADYGFSLSTLYGQKAIKGKYNSTLRSCYSALHKTLKDHYQVTSGRKNRKKGLFVLNRGYLFFGFIVIIAGIFFSFRYFVEHPSLTIAIFSISFVVAMSIVHLVFRNIMSAYTAEGRKVVDHLLGFRMYLAQTEKHIYNQLAPPERSLELFEKYLPYAIALGVENEWAEKFDDIMQKALAEGYQPGYYSVSNGSMQRFTMSDLSRGISSGLSSTISSASSPPSSSGGGSSGGGSSGGGGGGGGGGGW